MLDIKWIRENPEEFTKQMKKRGVEGSVTDKILHLDSKNRAKITGLQNLQQEKKKKSNELAACYKSGAAKAQISSIKEEVRKIDSKIADISTGENPELELKKILDMLPNIADESVPSGADESENKLVKEHIGLKGPVKNKLQHFEMGERLGMMDFAQTSKISGSRFVTLKGQLALLERALVNFMMDITTRKFGFEEISPPLMVRPKSMYNSGQLPKFAAESFETTNDYRLISTSEVPLVNLVSDTIICESKLPLRYCAYTPCFRSEAGSAGKDTRGMIRLHQFGKVELVSITTPEESAQEHEKILSCAEEILQRLELPYRVMLLCTQDMGFSASKTYDIEVWLPGQGKYREISSCSNCTDFQARRMKARYKKLGYNTNHLVHTLNGSSLPTGRTIAAIMENFQNKDGGFALPSALHAYMGGIREINIPEK